MNSKSKALFAVLGVALMLGCALVPLVADNSNGTVADVAKTEETAGSSLMEILGALLNNDSDQESYGTKDHFLMPVETSKKTPEVLTTHEITSEMTIKNKAVTLKGTYTFGNENVCGKIILDTGATLVLFPLTDTTGGFSLCNTSNPSVTDYDKIVVMKPGSMVSIFGLTFKLLEGSKNLNLFSLKSDEGTYCSISYSRDITGKFDFAVHLDNGVNDFIIADVLPFNHMDFPGGKDVIHMSGNLMPSSEGTGIVASGYVSLYNMAFDWLDYPPLIVLKLDNLSYSYAPNSSGANVKLSIHVSSNNYISIMNGRISLTGFELGIDNVSLKLVRSGNTVNATIDSPASMTLKLAKGCNIVPINTKDLTISIITGDFTISAKDILTSLKYTLSGDEWSLATISADANLSLSFSEFNTTLNFKTLTVYFNCSGNVSLDNVHFEIKSDGKRTLHVDKVSSTNVLSSLKANYTDAKVAKTNKVTKLFELWYGIESTTEITDIDIAKTDDTTSFGFKKLQSNFSALRGNSDWTGELTVDVLSITTGKDSEGTVILKNANLDRLYLRNNIPMAQVLSVLPEYNALYPGQITVPNIDVELKGVEYKPNIGWYKAGYLQVDVRNYANVDEFQIEFSNDLSICFISNTNKAPSYLIWVYCSGEKISGFVKNTGSERKEFVINNTPEVVFDLEIGYDVEKTFIEAFSFNAVLEIMEGNANFNGGALPFEIRVDGGANFTAEKLSAIGFTFVDDKNISGTVCLDTSLTLPLFYIPNSRSIDIGDGSYTLTPLTDGYTITLDLSKKTSGTLEASHGCKLPLSFEKSGFSMQSSDQKTGTFTVASTGAQVKMVCEKDKYNLTYEGISESSQIAHGSSVTITSQHPVKPGLEFYGWNDGSVIRSSGDVFVMPSYDVILKPVFIKTVTPVAIEEGNKTVLVASAPDADMVKIKISDIDWDVLRVTVGNTTFELDEKTFAKLFVTRSTIDQDTFIFQSITGKTAVCDSNGESAGEKIFHDLKIYTVSKDSITLKDITKSFDYSSDVTFKTTINVTASGSIKDFSVYELDRNGKPIAIDGVSFVKCGDGIYDVTFAMDHPAYYVIEPVYEDSNNVNGALATVIAVAVIAICAIGIALVWARRS